MLPSEGSAKSKKQGGAVGGGGGASVSAPAPGAVLGATPLGEGAAEATLEGNRSRPEADGGVIGDTEMGEDIVEDTAVVMGRDGAPLLPHMGDPEMLPSAPVGELGGVAETGAQVSRVAIWVTMTLS